VTIEAADIGACGDIAVKEVNEGIAKEAAEEGDMEANE